MLRRLVTLFPLLLLVGSAILLVFLNLCGANTRGVLNQFYWSQTDTSSIDSADRPLTRWTLYNTCGVTGGTNSNCGPTSAAFPYSPKDNFDSSADLPDIFVNDRSLFYYGTRIAYAFLLIGLALTLLALMAVLLSCCCTGFITGILSSGLVFVAFVFTVIAASLITATHVKGVDAFNKAGHKSSLGVKMFAFLWAVVAAQLLSFITLICTTSASRERRPHKL